VVGAVGFEPTTSTV